MKDFESDEVIARSFSQRELENGIVNLGGSKGFGSALYCEHVWDLGY